MLNKSCKQSRNKMVAHRQVACSRRSYDRQSEYASAEDNGTVGRNHPSSRTTHRGRKNKAAAAYRRPYTVGGHCVSPDGFEVLTEPNQGTRRYNKRAVAWKHAEDITRRPGQQTHGGLHDKSIHTPRAKHNRLIRDSVKSATRP